MELALNGARIVVLGSNSFGGSSLISRLLSDGADVIGINRSPEGSMMFLQHRWPMSPGKYSFLQADLNKNLPKIAEIIHRFQPSVLFDFAGQGMVAESWEHPDQWYTTNIVAKVRLHQALLECQSMRRYIRVSTPEVYGTQSSAACESWNFNPSTPYAVSHAAIDMSLRAYHQRYGFPVVFTRFANFYGPGQQLYRLIPKAIICGLTNRRLPLHGGGTAVRAFIYGSDVADGLVKAMNFGRAGEVYHFSPHKFWTILQVVEAVSEHLAIDLDALISMADDRPSKDHAYLMDSQRARSELGWDSRVDLSTGIESTANWVRRNLAEISSLPLHYIHKV